MNDLRPYMIFTTVNSYLYFCTFSVNHIMESTISIHLMIQIQYITSTIHQIRDNLFAEAGGWPVLWLLIVSYFIRVAL